MDEEDRELPTKATERRPRPKPKREIELVAPEQVFRLHRLWMSFVITLILLGIGAVLLFSPDLGNQKFGYGLIGSVAGAWLKGAADRL